MKIDEELISNFLNKFQFKYIGKIDYSDRYQINSKELDRRLISLFSSLLNYRSEFLTVAIYFNSIKITSDRKGTIKYIWFYEIEYQLEYRGLKLFLIHTK